MPSELLGKLFKRQEHVQACGETWESAPTESCADASHLSTLKLGAPSAAEWLRGLEGEEEEDTLGEALQEGLAERGDRPAHAPTEISDEDKARLEELAEQLHKMQDDFNREREQLSGEREELARREAEVRAREEALEAERERQRRLEEAVREYPMPEWLKQKETIKGTMNVGVVGNAGVGKSLFINRVRRIRPHADGWAPVGVKETTMEPTMYAFKNVPKVRLWDLPGAGTEAFPSATYIQQMGLRYFDKVVIVTAGRFTSNDVALRNELQSHEVPYYMVRTKVDIDIYNNQQDNGLAEKDTLAQISDDLKKTHEVTSPYLVSLRDIEAYDMPKLVQDLFPSLKRVMDASAPNFCPTAPAWNEPWALPPAYGEALAGLQGRWYDAYGAYYIIQNLQAHVTLREGQHALVPLQESQEGIVWWCSRWYLTTDSVAKARWHKELRWAPKNGNQDKPLIWWWAD